MFHDLKTAVPSCTANSKEHAVAKAKPHARHRHVPAPHTAKPLLPVAEGQEVAVVRVARAARLRERVHRSRTPHPQDLPPRRNQGRFRRRNVTTAQGKRPADLKSDRSPVFRSIATTMDAGKRTVTATSGSSATTPGLTWMRSRRPVQVSCSNSTLSRSISSSVRTDPSASLYSVII